MARIETTRWHRVSALLDILLEVDPGERGARLAAVRRDDPRLANEVALLLDQQTAVEAEAFLEGSALNFIGPAPCEGDSVGSYTLERPIGRGGMGVVWLGHRNDGRFVGRAAVKFLTPTLLMRGAAERFQREGSALARLAHPNIARLLDAGVAPAGQPYLVLEYVDGMPINEWCDARALDLRARARLLLDVLAAVAHAHKNLILHRDLKPSNILVTHDGQVKLLDFGIAKLLEDRGQATGPSDLTQFSGRAYTPDYAAPEQVQNGAMTTATDVYSLGVILYELLTGSRPYKPKRRSAAALEEAIAEQQAPLASSIATRPEDRRQLRGDLDAILNQALKKRADQRYASVGDLRADIEHYLAGRPVLAQPDSFGYRVAKFVARNRVVVSASAAVLVAVLAGSVVALWQAHEAHRQRDRAVAMSERNRAVADFVETMLTEVAPPDQPIRVGDLLERSMTMLMTGDSNPEHEAAILITLASYYLSAGDRPMRAKELLERSLELTRTSDDKELRSGVLCDNAYAAQILGRTREAQLSIEEGLRLSANDDYAAARCLAARAGIARASEDVEGMQAFGEQALARLRASVSPSAVDEASLLDVIAAAYADRGHGDVADRYFAASLAKMAEAGRGESPRAAVIRHNWAVASYDAGDYRQALINYDEALRISRRWANGGQLPSFLLGNRAKALRELGQYKEALEQFDLALASARASGYALMRVDALVNRASTYLAMGDLAHAEETMAILKTEPESVVDPQSATGFSLKAMQARLAAAHGDLADAAAGFSTLIDTFEKRKSSTSWITSLLRSRSDVYLRQGDLEGALADAQRAVQLARDLQGARPRSSLTGLALLSLSRVQEKRGEMRSARAAAVEAVAHLTDGLGEDHPETRKARAMAKAT